MSYIGHIGHIGCVGGASGGGHIGHIGHIGCIGGASGRRRPWGGNLPGFFWAPQPLEENLPGFFWAPWGGLLASLARGEDFCGGNPPGFLGRRTGVFGAFAEPSQDQPTGKPSAVAASRFSGEQRLNAWGV